MVFLPNDHPKKYRGPILPSNFQILLQLAEGLRHIHAIKLVHRDIKPENVLISASLPVKVTWGDFGLSKATNSGGDFSMSGLKGTETYIAPEMTRAFINNYPKTRKMATQQSDIFSSGCLFFKILTGGHHPFGSHSASQIDSNIQKGTPVNMKSQFESSL